MKIYYNNDKNNPSFYFMTWKENGIFCFNLAIPDMDTLILCPCISPNDEEIWCKAVKISEELNHEFNLICRAKNNYTGISKILKEVFNIEQDVIDKAYGRDMEIYELVKSAVDEHPDFRRDSYIFRKLFEKGRRYLKIWDGDKERAKKYLIEHDIPELRSYDTTLVDIWGEMHPTKRMLLHEFHDYWGDRLDKIVSEAIEKYPDKNDFDKAFYYTRDKLKDKDYGYDG